MIGREGGETEVEEAGINLRARTAVRKGLKNDVAGRKFFAHLGQPRGVGRKGFGVGRDVGVNLQLCDAGVVRRADFGDLFALFLLFTADPEQGVGFGDESFPFFDDGMFRRGEDDLLLDAKLFHLGRKLREADVLDVEVEVALGFSFHAREDFGDLRDVAALEVVAFPRADVEFAEFSEGDVRNAFGGHLGTDAFDDAFEVVVVKGNDDAVFGGAEVTFGIGAELPTEFKGVERVLFGEFARAAVALNDEIFQGDMVAHVPGRGVGCKRERPGSERGGKGQQTKRGGTKVHAGNMVTNGNGFRARFNGAGAARALDGAQGTPQDSGMVETNRSAAAPGTGLSNFTRRKFLQLAALAPWALSGLAEGATESLNELLSPTLKSSGLPALAAAAMKNGQLLGVGAVGLRKVGSEAAVTVEDKFHLGSDTKAMTATVTAMFVEEGKLRWQQTLAEIFPERAAKMNAAYRKVTLEMLLTHRAGTPANTHNYGTPSQPVTLQRLIYLDATLQKPPINEPGSQFSYSNAGYIIVGTILERISGKSWETLMQERLFRPLKITSAGFGPPSKPNLTDQPWGHVAKNGKFEASYSDNPAALGPAGTVHCSMADYMKFSDFHASEGKRPAGLLTCAAVKKLQTPDTGRTYAMGWGTGKRDWAKGRVLTHMGSNTKNCFIVWIAPEIEFSIAVATNAAGPNVHEIMDQVCGKLIQKFAKT
jgi:CubicO group peptidase (beta-lactamase class C family)